MEIDITIKNFRCFGDEKPACFSLRSHGFAAFVGVNNSGKSSLLKMFYELRDVFTVLSIPKKLVTAVHSKALQSFSIKPPISDKNELFHNGNDRDITLGIKCNAPSHDGHESLADLLITLPRNKNEFAVTIPSLQGADLSGVSSDQWLMEVKRPNDHSQLSLKALCEAMQSLGQAMYIGGFRNAINIGTKEDYFDIDIGQAFIKKWNEYKTGPIRDQNEAAGQLTRDISKLFGFDSLEISPTPDNQSLQLLINGKSFKLAEVGGGIAQFIVVLANVAIRRPTFVLIDEPELHLHPTLQMDFLTTLGSLASEGVVFSTHNIGLARAGADRIYTVQMTDGVSEVRDLETTPRLSEFVGELGFSGYRELGFEKLLLVEGRTDVKTIQQFLRLYNKDHKCVLVPLGGSAMITKQSESELEELKRISTDISVLIDSERNGSDDPIPADRQSFKEMCDGAEIPCCVLRRRATENYLADHAVKRVKGKAYRALGKYESLKSVPMPWAKNENWRIARAMTIDDLNDTDLGEFLNNL